MDKQILKNINFKQFNDEFGNIKQQFEVIRYDKRSNGEWIEEERRNSGSSYYIIDGQLYCKCDNSLLPMNMNFKSETCGACFQIGKEVINNHKIINNEILFTCKNELTEKCLSLHKQSYSNDTSFYSLQDANKNWKVNYASSDIN